MGKLDFGAKLVRSIEKIAKEQKAAEKAGDIETALQKNKELRNAIQAGVNDPAMPRAKPLSDADIQAFAERMAPQVEGKLTRGKTGAKTVAGKTQKQFEREKTLPVQRRVLPGQEDPSAPLPYMTMEDQKGGVIIGLSGDPTLARTELSGIDDVLFEKPVTLEGGPRYKNKKKFWASNIAGATNLIGAGRRASEQYGGAPIYAMYQKMPEGFGFAQHYLDSLLQYTRPDQLPKAAREALEDDIRKGFINAQGKRVTFPKFSGFDDLNEVSLATEANSILRKHIADRLEKSQLYGLRPAGDVQFAVTHPELTNLETGASGFKIAELPLDQQFTPSSHRTYTEDIKGTVLGQTQHPTPYDLIYRDELDLVRKNPKIAEEPFNTLKLLGPRQTIDEQFINELNEYQERMRRLIGKKKGGQVNMAGGGAISKLAKLLAELPAGSKAAQEAIAAEMAAREAAEKAAYAAHTLPSEAGKKGLSKAKEILTPDINKADGGAVDAPDWYAQLGAMLQNPELTWYDQLGEMLMAEGGAVKMADGGQTFPLKDPEEEQRRRMMEGSVGGNPMGDVAFSDTSGIDDRSTYQRILSLVKQKAKEQGREELLSLKDPSAITDLVNKGLIAENLGGVVDLFSLPFDAVDALLNKALKTDRRYLSSEQPFGGSESMKRGMEKAGMATKTERPLMEFTTGVVGPAAVVKAVKTAPKVVAGAKKAGEALAPTVADLLETQLRKSGMIQDIIKPEGGNWVKDATKKYVDPLRLKLHNADPAITLSELEAKYGKEGADEVINAGLYPNIREHSAINNFIDKKLTRYLQNEMGTASDPVRIHADTWQETKQQLLADKQKQIDKVMADIQKAQQARNVEPEVLTRSQARLRELEHEKSLIEHRKGLHYDLPQQLFGTPQRLRGYAGMPQENVAKSQVGKNWEDVTDKTIRNSQYKFQIPFIENDAYVNLKSLDPQEQIAMIRQMNNESLRKLGGDFAVQNPEAYAYSLDSGYPVSELGFDHLVDELRGALINDALPNNLRLTTKTLDKMSVPQAVEHVDKINAWRAAQKAEVNKARAANAATVVHKEYPEAGMKWVELKIPEMTENFKTPDRYEIKKPTPSSETFAIWDKENQQYITSGLGSEEAAVKHLHQTINQSALEDALKYEGEILQHCVGGYCPDVLSGKSRIYSLRDESGRPHATIEVQPYAKHDSDFVFYELEDKLGRKPTQEEWDAAMAAKPHKIKQIKGEGNRAPKEDLQPFVQDFVKSGDWSQVGDLQNTGLQQTKNAPWRKRFEDAGIDVPNYVSDKEYENLVKQYFEKTSTPIDPKFMQDTYGIPMKAQGGAVRMAKGGSIKHHKFSKELQKYAEGGTISDYNTSPDRSDGGLMILEKNGYA